MPRVGERRSNVPPLRGMRTPAPRRRRTFPFFTVALFSVLSAGVLMATVFRGDPASDFRNVLAWLQRLDFTSTAAQPPAGRRASDESAQAQPSADKESGLKAAMEKSAAERRANLRSPEDKPDQSAVMEAARTNQALEREREGAQATGREREGAATTSTIGGAKSSASDDASDTRLARAVDAPGAPANRDAPDATASRDAPGALANRPAAPENTALTARLIERASGLLRLGDIGGARLVLAAASDNGSARATFMLAETYDPRVLSTWNAMGTSADPAKARELYAKAYAGGIAEARARSEALAK
jgi:hypothetical protein